MLRQSEDNYDQLEPDPNNIEPKNSKISDLEPNKNPNSTSKKSRRNNQYRIRNKNKNKSESQKEPKLTDPIPSEDMEFEMEKPKPILKKSISLEGSISSSKDKVFDKVKDDNYKGSSLLRFSSNKIPLNNDINTPKTEKQRSLDKIVYDYEYFPEIVNPLDENLPSSEVKTKPKQESKPKVKIRVDKSENSNRISSRPKQQPERLTYNARTIWRPALSLVGLTIAAVNGTGILPTHIQADLTNNIKNIDVNKVRNEIPIIPNPIPISEGEKIEQMRAYHARLGIMNNMFNPDPDALEWTAQSIENHKISPNSKDAEEKWIFFKVTWFGGDKAWMEMNDMRLHDPFALIRYGFQNHLTHHKEWDWVDPYLESDELCKNMINAYRVSLKKQYKFGHRVPENAREAMKIDEDTHTTMWMEAIGKELG